MPAVVNFAVLGMQASCGHGKKIMDYPIPAVSVMDHGDLRTTVISDVIATDQISALHRNEY